MSQIGAAQQFHTDDEIKVSAKLFQQSAGVFARLRDVVLGMVQQEPTPDLMPDTLAALSALMTAQAQEAIYIKGHKDKMKATSMVKISAQVAEFYSEAQKMMSKDIVRGLWDKDWSAIVSGKNLAYQALAQYHQSEVCGEARQIGEQLSRLAESLKLFDTAQKYLPRDITGIWDIYPSVSKAHAAAKKDNDFIVSLRPRWLKVARKYRISLQSFSKFRENTFFFKLKSPILPFFLCHSCRKLILPRVQTNNRQTNCVC